MEKTEFRGVARTGVSHQYVCHGAFHSVTRYPVSCSSRRDRLNHFENSSGLKSSVESFDP